MCSNFKTVKLSDAYRINKNMHDLDSTRFNRKKGFYY